MHVTCTRSTFIMLVTEVPTAAQAILSTCIVLRIDCLVWYPCDPDFVLPRSPQPVSISTRLLELKPRTFQWRHEGEIYQQAPSVLTVQVLRQGQNTAAAMVSMHRLRLCWWLLQLQLQQPQMLQQEPPPEAAERRGQHGQWGSQGRESMSEHCNHHQQVACSCISAAKVGAATASTVCSSCWWQQQRSNQVAQQQLLLTPKTGFESADLH